MQPPAFNDDEFETLGSFAEDLASGAAVDWDAAGASGLSESHRAVLRQLRAVADIAGAHARSSGEGEDLGSPAATAVAATGDLRAWGPLIVRAYVGRGSFGDVYRAWDPRLDREVALKLLAPPSRVAAHAPDVIAEGRALARVRHSSVVTVYGADRIGGRVGVWMEFVEGRTLAQRISADGPLPLGEVLSLGADLARALSAVHRAGLLHRDVKAQNVICEAGGRIVLTDFGTAVASDGGEFPDGSDSHAAAPALPPAFRPPRATIAGTPLYLAPEVLDGAPQSVRSDVYALGVLLFHALTGTFPVTGRTLGEVRQRHRDGLRDSLAALRPDVPATAAGLVDRALASTPSTRFSSAEEFADALESALREPSVPAPRPWGRPSTFVFAATMLLVAGVVAWMALRPAAPGRKAPDLPPAPRLAIVAAFDHASGDETAAREAEAAVAASITRAGAYSLVSSERVRRTLALMRRPADAALDVQTAREIARRDGGIGVMVIGSVRRSGVDTIVEANVIVPATGAVVGSASERVGPAADLGNALTALAHRVSTAVAGGPALAQPSAEFEHVTVRSLEALNAFTQAKRAFDRAGARGGPALVEGFRRAIALEPDFAMAHTWLGWSRQGEPDAVEHFARGDELAAGATEAERAWARGSLLWARREFAAAADAFRELARIDPGNEFGTTGWAIGNVESFDSYARGSTDGVAESWARLALARPDLVGANYRAGKAMFASETRSGRAAEYFDRTTELLDAGAATPASEESVASIQARLRLWPAWDQWAQGNAGRAAALADPVCQAAEPGAVATALHWDCLALMVTLGRLRQADRHAAILTTGSAALLVAVHRDDAPSKRRVLEGYRPTQGVSAWSMWLSVQNGLPPDAGGDVQPFHPLAPFTLQHYVELLSGPTPATLRLFEEQWPMRPRRRPELIWLAQAYAATLERTGRAGRAIAVLQTTTAERRGAVLNGLTAADWVLTRHELAGLLRRTGRSPEAETVERELLALLGEADEDHAVAAALRSHYGGQAPAER